MNSEKYCRASAVSSRSKEWMCHKPQLHTYFEFYAIKGWANFGRPWSMANKKGVPTSRVALYITRARASHMDQQVSVGRSVWCAVYFLSNDYAMSNLPSCGCGVESWSPGPFGPGMWIAFPTPVLSGSLSDNYSMALTCETAYTSSVGTTAAPWEFLSGAEVLSQYSGPEMCAHIYNDQSWIYARCYPLVVWVLCMIG